MKDKIIGAKAYYERNDLDFFVVPDGTTMIAESAFAGCKNFERIFIPASVTVIEKDAFMGCDKLMIYCEGEPAEGWIDKTVVEHLRYEVVTPEDEAFNFHRSGGSFSSTVVERDEERHYCWNPQGRPVFRFAPKEIVGQWK